MTKSRRKIAHTTPRVFVVYVVYNTGGQKEYAYLCNLPNINQGDEVLGNNGARCTVQRTANTDPLATKFVSAVPDFTERKRNQRKAEIRALLTVLQRENAQLELWSKLARKSPEAKKLLVELKKLGA